MTVARQKIARRPTIDRDFRARFAGVCPRCGKAYEVGTVIVRSVRGYVHGVCPPKEGET
jgi:hypothetical protein